MNASDACVRRQTRRKPPRFRTTSDGLVHQEVFVENHYNITACEVVDDTVRVRYQEDDMKPSRARVNCIGCLARMRP